MNSKSHDVSAKPGRNAPAERRTAMGKMYFEGYGELEWLEPHDYYASAWKYLRSAEGEDGELYDIVIIGDYPCELRYTTI